MFLSRRFRTILSLFFRRGGDKMKQLDRAPFDKKAIRVDGRDIAVTGRWLRTAAILDEDWLEGPVIDDPETLLAGIRKNGLNADIFTFAQKIPDCRPRYRYKMEWDNVAAIPITTYQDWWEHLASDRRKDIKRAEKQGILVRTVDFDDELVKGIVEINNDIPFRQGKRFKHFGKDFETVKKEYATFPERSEFVAAYHNDELVAILKMVYVGELARFLEILSKTKYNDKRPVNALISKAVRIAEEKKKSYITYGRYYYGNKRRSSFTDFKQRNGFERILFPRYYIPLTAKGAIAIQFRLELGLLAIIPGPMVSLVLSLRSRFYSFKAAKRMNTDRKRGAK